MSEERQYCNDCGVETDGEFCENCDQYQKASISQIAGRSTQRLPTWGEWVSQQRGLAKKLGLNDIEEYLGKVCEVCGKPAKKGSKLPLCTKHKEKWRKTRNAARQRKWYENHKKTNHNGNHNG